MENIGMDNRRSWWEEFCDEEKENSNLRPIFELIKRADVSGDEDDLKKAEMAVKGLDKQEYSEEISQFNKRINILAKRLERQMSDDFPSMIKTLRTDKGYSLAKLSEMTGISASYINRIELGDRKAPSVPIIRKLSKALDFPLSSSIKVAGLEEGDDAATLIQTLYATNFRLTEDSEPMNIDDKEVLIELIKYIIDMEWGSSKHLDSMKIFELIDELKELQ